MSKTQSEIVILASHIGSTAMQALSLEREGVFLNTTSRGAFLRLASGQILFLSLERWRGPLTINIQAGDDLLSSLTARERFKTAPGEIIFSNSFIRIHHQEAQIWQAPFPVKTLNVYKTFKVSPEESLISRLGAGPGLTPLGDDVCLGYLLTLNRWGRQFLPVNDLQSINQHLVQAARQKTTALSAALIECAAQGQADERLILALDGMLTGSLNQEECEQFLSGWGHTSGSGVLEGIHLATNQI